MYSIHYMSCTNLSFGLYVYRELQQTLMSVNTIEEEKASLFKATEELQNILQVS